MSHEINFTASKEDTDTIINIAVRAEKLGHPEDRLHVMMDVTATHLNGNPLDLKRLLAADDYNFVHDIWGIYAHLDRDTGKLLNCFSPRFSAR